MTVRPHSCRCAAPMPTRTVQLCSVPEGTERISTVRAPARVHTAKVSSWTWPARRRWAASTLTPLPHISARSEEHTSELQSRGHLVCRLLLEKKNVRKRVGDAEHHNRNRN